MKIFPLKLCCKGQKVCCKGQKIDDKVTKKLKKSSVTFCIYRYKVLVLAEFEYAISGSEW